MIKTRLVFPVLVACAALALFAGCGGGGESSSGSDPATVAPPESAFYVEGVLQPSGSLKTDIEELASNVAGVDDLGGTIVSKLESTAKAEGEPFNYSEEVEPWLGEKAGVAFASFDGSNFTNFTVAIQTTDTGATEDFIETVAEEGEEPAKKGSYEGVDFEVESDNGTTIGVVGDLLVVAENEATFKSAVDASEGESLSEVDSYKSIASKAPDGALANAYFDIGGLIEQAGNQVDPQTEEALKSAGINLEEATALLSLVPGSDQVEIDIASAGSSEVSALPATDLLESLPADSAAAFAGSEYGKRLQEGIDGLDESGIPGQIPPHQLEPTLEKLGINLHKLTGSLEDAGVFVVGSSISNLGGAAVITTNDPSEAKTTVANLGLLLRSNHTPGVTAISGKAAGFSIHSAELGNKPIVIAAKGDRIGIGYGLPATLEGLGPVHPTLSENAAYIEAKKALGDTPISGFVDGDLALQLAENLASPLSSGFEQALPYLGKIEYLGFGAGTEGKLATLKVIVGLKK